jgi:hypothetical protein
VLSPSVEEATVARCRVRQLVRDHAPLFIVRAGVQATIWTQQAPLRGMAEVKPFKRDTVFQSRVVVWEALKHGRIGFMVKPGLIAFVDVRDVECVDSRTGPAV